MSAGDRAAALANEDLERIVKLVTERQTRRGRLALKAGERLFLVDAGELVFATLTDDTVTVVTTGLTGTSNYRTLDELQAQLDPEIFWRVHRGYLVNINKIKEIVPWFSRNYVLKMSDGKATEIPVSRSQTKRLREYLPFVTEPEPDFLRSSLLRVAEADASGASWPVGYLSRRSHPSPLRSPKPRRLLPLPLPPRRRARRPGSGSAKNC